MGGCLTVNTKFLPAHPFTEDHLECKIPSNFSVEDNGQPPLLIWKAAFIKDNHEKNSHNQKQALEQDINAQDQFILASSLER